MIVCTYLIANILNVIITAWEHIDKDSLYRSLPNTLLLLDGVPDF